jgi:hypothetical protein
VEGEGERWIACIETGSASKEMPSVNIGSRTLSTRLCRLVMRFKQPDLVTTGSTHKRATGWQPGRKWAYPVLEVVRLVEPVYVFAYAGCSGTLMESDLYEPNERILIEAVTRARGQQDVIRHKCLDHIKLEVAKVLSSKDLKSKFKIDLLLRTHLRKRLRTCNK